MAMDATDFSLDDKSDKNSALGTKNLVDPDNIIEAVECVKARFDKILVKREEAVF